ncbi:hypothetical protein [Chitinophaga sp. Cy-1792]|nr:hypothetical protein [Chitinophaga sp. Cy-1792]
MQTILGANGQIGEELQELLQRYEYDNIFKNTKFRKRFPHFAVTTYQ